MNVGPWQIILIVVVIVLLFGAKRLPDTARSVGRSMRIFKSEMQEMTTDDEQSAPAQIEKSGNPDGQNGYVASQTDKKKQADEA